MPTGGGWGEIEMESERERGRISSRLCAVSAEPDLGLDRTDRKIMT